MTLRERFAAKGGSIRRSYHRAYYWRNLERRRAAARLSRWRQRARAMGIDV